jgi:SAM-dependent methyltransferase
MVRGGVKEESAGAVLDLGAGPMGYAIALARTPLDNVLAADLQFRTVDLGRAKAQGVSTVLADGLALPFAPRSFDAILISSLLQMVPDPRRLLAECRRVLRPSGTLVLTVPNHYQFIPWVFRAPVPVRPLLGLPSTIEELTTVLGRRFGVAGPAGYYSYEELTQLLDAAGFEITEHAYVPGWLGSLIWEVGVIGSGRLGRLAFVALLPAYPVARLYDRFRRSSAGSEHVVRAVKR